MPFQVSAVQWEGYTITGEDGRPATLAVIDQDGKVLDAGPEVAQEIWDLAILSYRQVLVGESLLRIYSTPEGLLQDSDDE
uniref:Uncharacterized protein n=1 Tax=Paraburkholderia sprentiae WSM5005 TaxID=754502 RepID=A0A1I9YVF8_9BURK